MMIRTLQYLHFYKTKHDQGNDDTRGFWEQKHIHILYVFTAILFFFFLHNQLKFRSNISIPLFRFESWTMKILYLVSCVLEP